jgi:Dolichyl-phosphate-mannose-protein mannosyltransferase
LFLSSRSGDAIARSAAAGCCNRAEFGVDSSSRISSNAGLRFAVAVDGMPATTYSATAAALWPKTSSVAVPFPWARVKLVVLAVASVLAVAIRINALATYGLSEDELNKVNAIEQYRSGHFDANAEHPMLMKLAMWGSVEIARAWNHVASPDRAIAIETAVRLPNAVAGAATTVVLYGIADLLFGDAAAVVVALIWAFDVNAISINRIGKEDSFLLLFFLLAVFLYERAKRVGIADPGHAQRWYTASGAAFGLMLASKYMPGYLGIYALYNVATDRNPGRNRPRQLLYYGAMCAAFLIANPIIVMPNTWRYMLSYVHGDLLAHHGFLYNGALYVTNVPISPLGVPATYYLRLFATKVPLVLLAALVPGVIEMVRRPRERGFALLRVLAVFLLLTYSLMAAKFLRYSLPMLATLDLIAAVGLVAGIGWLLRKGWLSMATRTTVSTLALVMFGGSLVVAQQRAAPFYSLFQNAIGARVDVKSLAFPEETYDYGVREAVASIAAVAAPSAAIVSDASSVVAYYLQRDGRPDIVAQTLSTGGLITSARETWVILQDEHTTFENRLVIEQLRTREKPWMEYRVDGVVAVQVFRPAER